MMRARVVVACAAGLAVVAAVAASCASVPTGTPSAESAPDVAWKDKTHEQRMAHMKSVVKPTMAEAFQRIDAEEFANFDCSTCHGSGAADGSYRMPSADLPRLSVAPGAFDELLRDEEEMTTFMANVVVPGMAAMLGEKPYGPDARDGLGCFRCHMTKQ